MNKSALLLCIFSFLCIFLLSALITGCQQTEDGNLASGDSLLNGYFEGDVVASWDSDGRKMTLREDFAYIDPNNRRWYAPAGSVVDGASIPPAFWTFVGGPFEGQYRKASVVHDVGCIEMKESWEDVHRMFYDACVCGGVDEQTAKVLYYAVYHFGPRWEPVVETVVETHQNDRGQLVQEQVKRRRIRCSNPKPPTSDEIQQVVELVNDENPAPVELEQITREKLCHRPRRRRRPDGSRRQPDDDLSNRQRQNSTGEYETRRSYRQLPISRSITDEVPRYDQTQARPNDSFQSRSRRGDQEIKETHPLVEEERQWIARQVKSHLVNRLKQPEPDTYAVERAREGYRVTAWFYERDQQGQPIESSNSNFNVTVRVSAVGEVMEILR